MYDAWAPARGEQGGQAPTLEKIRAMPTLIFPGWALAHPAPPCRRPCIVHKLSCTYIKTFSTIW